MAILTAKMSMSKGTTGVVFGLMVGGGFEIGIEAPCFRQDCDPGSCEREKDWIVACLLCLWHFFVHYCVDVMMTPSTSTKWAVLHCCCYGRHWKHGYTRLPVAATTQTMRLRLQLLLYSGGVAGSWNCCWWCCCCCCTPKQLVVLVRPHHDDYGDDDYHYHHYFHLPQMPDDYLSPQLAFYSVMVLSSSMYFSSSARPIRDSPCHVVAVELLIFVVVVAS
jgi:hypothetical protein